MEITDSETELAGGRRPASLDTLGRGMMKHEPPGYDCLIAKVISPERFSVCFRDPETVSSENSVWEQRLKEWQKLVSISLEQSSLKSRLLAPAWDSQLPSALPTYAKKLMIVWWVSVFGAMSRRTFVPGERLNCVSITAVIMRVIAILKMYRPIDRSGSIGYVPCLLWTVLLLACFSGQDLIGTPGRTRSHSEHAFLIRTWTNGVHVQSQWVHGNLCIAA